VDLLLGGNGTKAGVREVTEIENTILASVLQVVMRELNTTWKPVGMQFEFEKQETQARIARLMPGGEQTLCVSLDVQMPGVQGLINLCLPAMVLNTLHRSQSAAGDATRKRVTLPSARMEKWMAEAQVCVSMRLPASKIASRALHGLEVGSVLELGLPKTTRAELRVGGVKVCGALPVASGDRLSAALQDEVAGKSALAVMAAAGMQEQAA
jgi:flagellar motor switch protein FliM